MHRLVFAAVILVHKAVAGGPAVMGDHPAYANWARYSVLTAAGPSVPRPEVFSLDKVINARYRITGEESLSWIAKTYSTTVSSLKSTNQNEFVFMRRGGYMRVHNHDGYLYEVYEKGETLDGIVWRFKRDRDVSDFKRRVIEINGLPASAFIGKYRFEKGDRVLLPETYISFDSYTLPFTGGFRISSGFGYRRHPIFKRRRHHNGMDIAKPYGTPVFPSKDGRITFAGWEEGYGNMVEVEHSHGIVTRYGHLSAIYVKTGDRVEKGKTRIGDVGMTGWTTGPHLHFEMRDAKGRPMNPYYLLGKG